MSAGLIDRHCIFRDIAGPQLLAGSVVTIGGFDGMHLGHQALVARCTAQARARQLPAVLLSFDPLPADFFGGARVTPRLDGPVGTARSALGAGIDLVGLLRFNRELASLTPAQFVIGLLVERLGAQQVVVGEDFRFGADRAGDVETLRMLGEAHGFAVEVVPAVEIDGERISSSQIRELLAAGRFAEAARRLGRPWRLEGRVGRGRALGRTLGYPTANVGLSRRPPPISGIFAATVEARGLAGAPAVISVGTRPTLRDAGERIVLEAHLLDFEGDLYGRQIAVEPLSKLRAEARFESLAALQHAMTLDEETAREVLRTPPDTDTEMP